MQNRESEYGEGRLRGVDRVVLRIALIMCAKYGARCVGGCLCYWNGLGEIVTKDELSNKLRGDGTIVPVCDLRWR